MTARVIVASRLFTPEVGAAAFRLQALVDGLHTAGANVEVLTTIPPHNVERIAATSTVSRWPVLRDRGGNVRGYLQYLSFDIPLFFRLLLARGDIVVSEPPPTTGLMVAASSWFRRRPYVYYAADIWTDALAATNAPAPVVALMRFVEGRVLRRARKVIAISDGVKDRLHVLGVEPRKIVVVNNGVSTALFRPGGDAVDPGYPYFVYTGTMSEWQGADIFIDAMVRVVQKFPSVRLHFLGQGSAEDSLREKARRSLPGKITFGGVVPPEEAARWIRGAAASLVSIVPNQGYDFAKPTKVYASAACGTPVVYAGSGACAEMITAYGLGSACRFSSDDVADAMMNYLNEPEDGREARAKWVDENASLANTGRSAADETLRAIGEVL